MNTINFNKVKKKIQIKYKVKFWKIMSRNDENIAKT